MNKFSVLLCDEDRSYVNAIMRFLVTSKKNIFVTAYTSMETFLNGEGSFDLALMGKTFLRSYAEMSPEIHVKRVLYLSSQQGEQIEEYETFYKFQNMAVLMEKIIAISAGERPAGSEGEFHSRVAIYSPIYHDLRLPFAITYAHAMASEQKVLFLDLEDFSPASDLIPRREETKDLYDIIYLMESKRDEDFDITPYLYFYEDIAMLPTFANPENIACVTEEQWQRLFYGIERAGFAVVVLFDQLIQGYETLLMDFDDVILLGRSEDYFLMSQKKCVSFMQEFTRPGMIHEVTLNMSANGLVDGTYSLKHLMEGNLGSFVRNEFKRTLAVSNT